MEANIILKRIDRLTPREAEVLGWVLEGYPNKRIALVMGITERTVKTHRGRVMEKMEATSIPHLVRMCIYTGLRWEALSKGDKGAIEGRLATSPIALSPHRQVAWGMGHGS
jgi:DNA-binding CsgD family transcriptional regulator